MRRAAPLVLAGLLTACVVTGPGSATDTAQPAPEGYEVVALGASNTEGHGQGRHSGGVSRDEAYPAQREHLLAAEGCHVRVLNAGQAGATTGLMLATLPTALSARTKVVILQPGTNDEGGGAAEATDADVEAIRRAVEAQGSRLILLDHLGKIAGPNRTSDGQHFTAQGYARIAQYLAPQVRAAGVCGA